MIDSNSVDRAFPFDNGDGGHIQEFITWLSLILSWQSVNIEARITRHTKHLYN